MTARPTRRNDVASRLLLGDAGPVSPSPGSCLLVAHTPLPFPGAANALVLPFSFWSEASCPQRPRAASVGVYRTAEFLLAFVPAPRAAPATQPGPDCCLLNRTVRLLSRREVGACQASGVPPRSSQSPAFLSRPRPGGERDRSRPVTAVPRGPRPPRRLHTFSPPPGSRPCVLVLSSSIPDFSPPRLHQSLHRFLAAPSLLNPSPVWFQPPTHPSPVERSLGPAENPLLLSPGPS